MDLPKIKLADVEILFVCPQDEGISFDFLVLFEEVLDLILMEIDLRIFRVVHDLLQNTEQDLTARENYQRMTIVKLIDRWQIFD